ncbi:chorismate mutase family protein [Lonsdalea quercina]|uniref:chorismate mutase family protein n=1 Tax=Lonsdalea quercina TaxID=71657 RepID=UPI00397553E2
MTPKIMQIYQVTETAPMPIALLATGDGRFLPSKEVSERTALIGQGLLRQPGVSCASPSQEEENAANMTLTALLPRLHHPHYLDGLRHVEPPRDPAHARELAQRYAAPDIVQNTLLDPDCYPRAEASAVVSLLAARGLTQHQAQYTYALCRPPGHHAGKDFLGGYCYLNNAAVAARTLADEGLGPVSVIDIDHHVGNGTSDVLSDHADIRFYSLHALSEKTFPYRHAIVPSHPAHRYIGFETPPDASAYLAALDDALTDAISAGSHSLVVSVGFDIIEGDPHGIWGLSPEIFLAIGERFAAANVPICFVQEGGYRMSALSDCAFALADGLSGSSAQNDIAQPQSPFGGLEPFRVKINALDDAIIHLIAQRIDICTQVAAYKRTHDIPMMQPGRVDIVKKRCAERAASHGLDPAFAIALYERIIDEACRLEDDIINNDRAAQAR